MRVLFFLIFVVLISCGGATYNCGEIDRIFEKDGAYFFALILDESGGDNGKDGRVYGDISVDKATYDLKKIGDTYSTKNYKDIKSQHNQFLVYTTICKH